MLQLKGLVVFALWLALTATVSASVEIKLKDGSRWRGEVADVVELRYMQQGVEVPLQGKLLKVENLYIQIEATVAGKTGPKTIFKSDIVWMKTVGAADPAASPSSANPTTARPGVDAPAPSQSPSDPASSAKTLGVFVLPLEGGVGQTFRHEEIKKMGEYLDKNYGPGQILILLIDSNGGSAAETDTIAGVLADIKKRHRVIAWVHKAISAGAATAMVCNEIYFMTEGTCGSVTGWNPGTGISEKGEELARAIQWMERICEGGGHYRGIGAAMKTNPALLSYDKDPVTGDVTWYASLEGEYILSRADENLCFTASNAEHCGFSDGTADTGEELAKLLNMPKWHETSDYGRRIAKEWQRTYEEAEREIPLLRARYNYKGTGSGDIIVVLGTRISIINEMISWWDRLGPNSGRMVGAWRHDLERELAELRKQVADIKRAQRQQ